MVTSLAFVFMFALLYLKSPPIMLTSTTDDYTDLKVF